MGKETNNKLLVMEGFSGYGSQSLQLTSLGIEHEVVGTMEIDPYAIIAYAAVHKLPLNEVDVSADEMRKYLTALNIGYDFKEEKSSIPKMGVKMLTQLYQSTIAQKCYGDISLVDAEKLPYIGLFTYSFPCTSISAAGNQDGLDEDSGTKSSLLWECKKIISTKKPKFLMMENVKNLVSKKFKDQFDKWIEFLDSQGYNSYWKVINAKDCGIPQNRERVFLISILKEFDDGQFKFEDSFDSGLRLRDILESNVDESFYMPLDKTKKVIEKYIEHHGKEPISNSVIVDDTQNFDELSPRFYEGIVPTLRSQRSGLKVIEQSISAIRGRGEDNDQQLEVNNTGISNTITTVQKDNLLIEKAILRNERTEFGKEIRKKYEAKEVECKRDSMRSLCPRTDDISNTITTVQKDNLLIEKYSNEIEVIGRVDLKGHDLLKRVYNPKGICPTVTTGESGNSMPKIIEIGLLKEHRHSSAMNSVLDPNGICPTIDTMQGGGMQPKVLAKEEIEKLNVSETGTGIVITYEDGRSYIYRIRKLTPTECLRLMGLSNEEVELIKSTGISNSQLYKLAGNSIVKQAMGFLKNLPNLTFSN